MSIKSLGFERRAPKFCRAEIMKLQKFVNILNHHNILNHRTNLDNTQFECSVEQKQHLVQDLTNKIEKTINQDLEKILANTKLSDTQKHKKILNTISQIESQVRSSAINLRLKNNKICLFSWNEQNIQTTLLALEEKAYTKVTEGQNTQVEESRRALLQNTSKFEEQVVSESLLSLEMSIPVETTNLNTSAEYHKKNVTNVINEILQAQYARHELGIIEHENTEETQNPQQNDIPYQLLSPEGEFLDKNRKLYSKAHTANPYHEQGRVARTLSLVAIETADAEYANGNKPDAELAYQIGEATADIALGMTPYVGLGKDVYEALTGHHLLTGRELTSFEQTMAVMGVALSGDMEKILHFGNIKISLDRTEKVLGRIQERALEKVSIFTQSGVENFITTSKKINEKH